MKKILITGASGFVGSFLVAEALERGLEVHAGVRKTSSRKYLQDDRIHFFEVNFTDIEGMAQRMKAQQFDYIIHNAGIVGAPKREDYFRVNCEYTKNFVQAIEQADLELKKFTYTSSLAAYGPASNEDLNDFVKETDIPKPITAYGESKLKAEQFLKKQDDLPWLIMRPTAVYGPRETDIYSFFQIVNRRLETYIGFDKQQLTFIYVKDLVRVMLDATLSDFQQKAYFIADGDMHPAQDLGKYAKQFLNRKTLTINVPTGLVRVIAFLAEGGGKLIGNMPTFNLEKVAELQSKNWRVDASGIEQDFNFKAKYNLEKGLEETLNWYKENKWL
ncbi:MAG: nucleoside-diphosphate-sugar epimerase [Paraglaciecola sp.]|jgi:nucleoside-diphosphate-sugar epimerase